MCIHIPNRSGQMVIYYVWYNNVLWSKRKKKTREDLVSSC